MIPLILPLFDPIGLGERIADGLATSCIACELRRFPDSETYLRIHDDVIGRNIIVLAALDRPDDKLIALIAAADLLRDLGAARVTLLVPYLPYMRQDKRFRPGEALTSRTFATLISEKFDTLITIDPHLHRYRALSDIYTCETISLSAASLLAQWIKQHVQTPFLIGPDAESRQWVSDVAGHIGADFNVLTKTRHGDRDLEMSDIGCNKVMDHTPVLIDDTISTGTTLAMATRKLIAAGTSAPVCCAVHGIFSGSAYADLIAAGAANIVTTNTIANDCADIDISTLIISALSDQPSVSAI